jgi:hypothetical protein
MKLAKTILVAQVLLPNTSSARWNQTTSKISPAAPETKKARITARSAEVRAGTFTPPRWRD